MIFYMGINIGAFFAPFAATGIRNWFLKTQGFLHDGSLACHVPCLPERRSGEHRKLSRNWPIKSDLRSAGVRPRHFAQNYIDAFSRGYNYAFGIAAGAWSFLCWFISFSTNIFPRKGTKVAKAKAKRKLC